VFLRAAPAGRQASALDIDASAGAVDEVERIVARIRARCSRVQIMLRANSGFARDQLMAWCEANGVEAARQSFHLLPCTSPRSHPCAA
jgi:hypothetical protein